MAKGVNKVILLGHLGNDPEMRYSAGGMAVANVRLATNSSTKNKQTGEWEDLVEWHRVIFFDKLAEIAGEYLRKGSQVYVEGRLQTRKWQDQQGQDRYTTEIVASEMQMIGSRMDNATASYAPSPTAHGGNVSPSSPSSPPSKGMGVPPPSSGEGGHYSAPPPPLPSRSPPSKSFDDDIPF